MDFEGTMGLGVEGWRAIACGILEGDGGADCFITYHPYTTSSTWFHHDNWLTANGIQGSRNETPNNDILIYKRVLADYLRSDPIKPVLFLEGSYENERNCYGQLPPTTPKNVRMQFFYAYFAGAAGFTYGHCKQWQQCKDVDHLDSPGVAHISIAAKFLLSREWWKLVPNQSIIVQGEGEGERRKTAVVAEGGRECLIYFPERDQISVKLNTLSGPTINAEWFSPETGDIIPCGTYPAIGEQWFPDLPIGWEDAVLILKPAKSFGE
jgi:hypothetical protein